MHFNRKVLSASRANLFHPPWVRESCVPVHCPRLPACVRAAPPPLSLALIPRAHCAIVDSDGVITGLHIWRRKAGQARNPDCRMHSRARHARGGARHARRAGLGRPVSGDLACPKRPRAQRDRDIRVYPNTWHARKRLLWARQMDAGLELSRGNRSFPGRPLQRPAHHRNGPTDSK